MYKLHKMCAECEIFYPLVLKHCPKCLSTSGLPVSRFLQELNSEDATVFSLQDGIRVFNKNAEFQISTLKAYQAPKKESKGFIHRVITNLFK